jgi:hypothetical protein
MIDACGHTVVEFTLMSTMTAVTGCDCGTPTELSERQYVIPRDQ